MYHKHFSTRMTPQSQVVPGREDKMTENKAGGYAFAVDDWMRLHRFLILGAEGGTYYTSERSLTVENAQAVLRCIKKDGVAVVEHVRSVSVKGLAPRNNPALFVLAMCAGLGDIFTRRHALKVLPDVCRIGTHLFTFLNYVQAFRGWGRTLRESIGSWYNDKEVDKIAYQVVKYRQREGWTHRDALRLSHPKPRTEQHDDVFNWIVKGDSFEAEKVHDLPKIIQGFVEIQKTSEVKHAAELIRHYGLPREAVPTDFLNKPIIWEALLDAGMPMTAMIRNLGNMTKLGVLTPMGSRTKEVTESITNRESLGKARIHPLLVLEAMITYGSGHGYRGSGSWTPIQSIVDALDSAFYLCFQNVEPTNKRLLFGIDVSASMSGATIGNSRMTAAQASGALALVSASVEKEYMMMGFCHEFTPLSISPRMRLDNVFQEVQKRNFGRTDCAVPMMYAENNKIEVDAFIILTDNETWAGEVHPFQALQEYRRKMGIPAKLIVVGMTSNGHSIADPDDGGMLDVVGWDSSVPRVMSDFIKEGI